MSGASGKPILAMLIAGLVGGAVGGGLSAWGLINASRQEVPLAELQTSQSALAKELTALQAEMLTPDDLTPLATSLADLAKEAATADTVKQLSDKLARLEESYRAEVTTLRGARAKAAMAALAVREIENAIDTGAAFDTALDQLRVILDDDAGLKELTDELETHAAGLATLSELTQELDTIRVEAIRASGETGGNWVNRTVENLRALIDVEGLPELKGVDALLRDAKDKTAANQLQAAMTELRPLLEEVPSLQGWLAKAEARQAAIDLLADIDRRLDERVSRQG